MTSISNKYAGMLRAFIVLFGVVAGSSLVAGAQAQETLLFTADFETASTQEWELEPGWFVADGVLTGQGHQWAWPQVGPWQDFRLQLRLRLREGMIHLVYRVNDAGRYFIGFHPEGSYLKKQYWPETFVDLLEYPVELRDPGRWHQIEIAGQGPRLRFSVDGELEWEYVDSDPLLGGSFAFETLDESVAQIDAIRVFGPAGISPSWVRTGGPLGGLGYDVRMRPDHPEQMYVTDAWAGVFLSTNGGRTWVPASNGISARGGESGDAIPIFSLTIDPHDNDVVWAGTQNVRGIFKSTDAGRSWVKTDQGISQLDGISFRGFTVDPRSSDIVYAAAEIASWAWAPEPRGGLEFDLTQGVVYKTTDGGQQWRQVWRGNNLARYVWINPRDPDTVYVSTGIFDREAANSDPGAHQAGGEGILKSTDGGQNWSHANNGLRNLYVNSLFMHPQDPDILLAGTGNIRYVEGAGVYLSADGGRSWQRTLASTWEAEGFEAVEFALSDPDIAYAASELGIYRSDDRGRTWQCVCGGDQGWGAPGVRAGFPIDIQVDPRDADRLFINNYGGGNFLSEDGGRSWTVASTGYTGAQVRAIAVDATQPARVYAAARSGIFVSANGGNQWTGLNFPPVRSMEWTAVALDPADPEHILAATNWGGSIVESRTAGRQWHVVQQEIGPNLGWRALAFAPSDPTIAYAGTAFFPSAGMFGNEGAAAGIYVSGDGGATWKEANSGLSRDAHVTSLAPDRQTARRVYAGTSNHGVLMTADGGQIWTALNQGLPPAHTGAPMVLSLALDPADAGIVLAGLWRGGVYRSTDGGGTWHPASPGLNPEATVTDLVFDPTHGQIVYAADLQSGVYRSEDAGRTWRQINTSLRTRAVNRLALSGDGQHLYAATEGEGVYRLDLNGLPPGPASGAASAGTNP